MRDPQQAIGKRVGRKSPDFEQRMSERWPPKVSVVAKRIEHLHCSYGMFLAVGQIMQATMRDILSYCTDTWLAGANRIC